MYTHACYVQKYLYTSEYTCIQDTLHVRTYAPIYTYLYKKLLCS